MPTLPSVLASIPGLGGYLAKAEYNNQAGIDELHQAAGVNTLLTSIHAQQQERQLREAVSASGGDLQKAMQAAIAGGNLAGAAKLAPLLKLEQERKMTEQFAGAGNNIGSLTADQLDQLASRAAIANHPGAVGFARMAEQRRAKENSTNTLNLMRDTPQGVAAGTVVPGTNQQAVADIPPDERAAFEQVARATDARQPATVAPQPGDAQTMGGGALAPLIGSKNPAIAARAKVLQTMINNPSFKGDATAVQREIDSLTALEARNLEAGNRLVTVVGAGGAPVYTPASQAAGMAPAPRTSAAGSADFTPEALNMTAKQYLAGDRQAVQGYARNATARIALQNEIVAEARRQNMGGADIAAKMADFAGITAGSRTVGTRAAQIELASSEALKMMDIVEKQSAKFDRSNFVPWNMALKAYDENTGKPEVRAYGAAINSLVNVYARAINPSGVATVSDKEHARDILRVVDSPDQVGAVLAVLKQEMEAARSAPGEVRAATRAAVTGAPAAAAAAAGNGGWSIRPANR